MWVVLLGYNDFEAYGALLRRSNADWRPNMAYYCDKVTWKNLVELGEFSSKPAPHRTSSNSSSINRSNRRGSIQRASPSKEVG
jgi:hypothetical protein